MSHIRSDEEDPPLQLILLLAIAGRLDAQQRLQLAKKLNDERLIYHLFSVLDSLSFSNSMFRYVFELCTGGNDTDLIHQFLTSPAGIATITTEALFLISFSLMASLFDNEEEKNKFKKWVATSWPYLRDMLKGLKNTYKGWRSTLQVIRLLSGSDLTHLLVPIGLGLGIISALNRSYLMRLKNQRESWKKDNKELLNEILAKTEFCPRQRKEYFKKICKDSNKKQYITATLTGGIIDGVYFYMGVLCLAPLSSPLFIALASITLFYVVMNTFGRLYDEYIAQMELLRSQIMCEIALITWEINGKGEHAEAALFEKYWNLKQQFDNAQATSYLLAAVSGIKHGIFAYGVMSGALFILGNLFVISGVGFPPVLLTVCVFSGLALIIGFMGFMLWQHHNNLCKGESESKSKVAIKESTEVLRGISSGLSKGYNVTNFILTPLQERDGDGAVHDSSTMITCALITSVLFAAIWGFKSFAKEFGKPKPEQSVPKPKVFGESSEPPPAVSIDVPKKKSTPLVTYSIFKKSSATPPATDSNSCCFSI